MSDSKEYVTLTARMQAVADMVPTSRLLADVGTDHAYLPLYLCQTNKIQNALATDINKGPIAIAERHIRNMELESRIATKLCNGLSGVEEYCPDVVTICGMGGELIVSILSSASWLKKQKTILVLQPMTHAEDLRRYLAENGFSVLDETMASEGRRFYTIIKAVYTGEIYVLSPTALYFGPCLMAQPSAVFLQYLKMCKNSILKRKSAREEAGRKDELDGVLLAYIEKTVSAYDQEI